MWPALVRTAALPLCLLWPRGQLCAQNNVLILLLDDVGVDNIGVYGEGANPPPTPNIDALARRGVLFRNAWSNPHCSPTRACIQTGRYSLRTGVGIALCEGGGPRCPVLTLDETTMPEALDRRQSGYAHAAIGKWHLSDARNGGDLGPNLAGWSHYAGLLGAHPSSYYNWPRTVDGVTSPSTQYATTQHVDDALAWIASGPGPWVCYLAFTAAHAPYHAPPDHLHTQSLQGLDPRVTPIPFYKAMVEAIDTEIGRLFTSLGPALLASTDVFLLGDNGTPAEVSEPPFLPSHGKKTLFEGGINVPWIVAGPSVGGAPREESALVSAVDLFTTVLELCGVTPDVPLIKIDAISFAPLLRSPGQSVRSTVFAEAFQFSFQNQTDRCEAIRDPIYKLIRCASGVPFTEGFFDLAADPFEQNNLLAGSLTAVEQDAYTALQIELTRITDVKGSFSSFGSTGCEGSNGQPTIAGSGTPQVGSSYVVSLTNGPICQPAHLLIGASSARWTSLSLPFDLTEIAGGRGCFIDASGELTVPMATGPTGDAAAQIRVPNLSVLISASIYHDWLLLDPMAPNNPLGVTSSDGAVAVLGALGC